MTRAQIKVCDNELKNKLISLYVHSDGSPDSLGLDIAMKYKDYEETDGINNKEQIYNGIEDFTIQLIWFLKNEYIKSNDAFLKSLKNKIPNIGYMNNEAGYLYITQSEYDKNLIDYEYTLWSEDKRIYIKCIEFGNLLFDGTLAEFVDFIRERGNE